MRKSEIHIDINLDENNIPNKIMWDATDSPAQGPHEAKAMALSLWDGIEKGKLKIDLWNNEMEVHEMKQFAIEIISGLADTIRNATSDEIMAMEMENMCRELSKRLEQELKLNEQMK